MFKKLKVLLRARKALQEEQAFTEAHGIEPVNHQTWDWQPSKTYKKAADAATTTGVATVATGGPLAALLILVRGFAPQYIPWGVDGDAPIIAAVTTILSSIIAFWRKWKADKAAHRG